MTQSLRSLRVVADVDANGVSKGTRTIEVEANKIVQAFGTMRSAKGKLDAALLDAKPSQAVGQMFSQIEMLASKGEISLQKAASYLVAIKAKYGLVGDATSALAQGQVNLSKAIGLANQQLAQQQSIQAGQDKFQTMAKYDPRARALFEYSQYRKQVQEDAARVGLSHDLVTRSIGLERKATLDLLRAQREASQQIANLPQQATHRGWASPVNDNHITQGGRFAALNSAQQIQDIFVTSQMGQSIPTIALQQGMQLGTALQMGLGNQGATGVVKGLGAAFLSILHPMNLVAIGVTAAAAAAIKYGIDWMNAADKIDDSIKKQIANVAELKKAYEDTVDPSKVNLGDTIGVARLKSQQEIATLQKLVEQSRKDLVKDAPSKPLIPYSPEIQAAMNALPEAPVAKALSTFEENAQGVNAEFLKFRDSMVQIARDTSLEKWVRDMASNYVTLTSSVAAAIEQIREADRTQGTRVTGNASERDLNLLREGTRLRDQMNREIERTNRYAREADAAAQLSMTAKSPAQKEAAARAAAEAQHDLTERAAIREQRIVLAASRARREAEYALTEEAKARVLAIDKALEQQKFDLSLIGQTTTAASGLRFEFEQLAAVREAAARNGVTADEKEIAAIKIKAAEYAKYAELIAKANLNKELAFEMEQAFRSAKDQAIASRLRGAGLAVDLNSPEAQLMRQIEQVNLLKDGVTSFVTDLRTSFLNNGGDFGDAFGEAARNAALKQLDKIAELGTDMIARGLAGLFGLGSGGMPSFSFGAAGAASSSSAAADAGINFAANSNYAPGAVTRSTLPNVASLSDQAFNARFTPAGTTKTGIPLSVVSAQGLTAKVNAQYADRFQGLLSDLTKQGYDISSLGEGGYSYRTVKGSKNLSNHSFGNAIDINPRQNPWSNKFQTNLPDNINDLAKKNGLFWGGNWKKPDTMHFQVDKSITPIDRAVADFGKATAKAAESVGTFDTGITSAVKTMGSVTNGGGGGGGSFGGGNLFGEGLGGLFSGLAMGLLSFGLMSLFSKKESKPVTYDTSSPRSYGRYGSSSYSDRAPASGGSLSATPRLHVTVGFSKSNGGITPMVESTIRSIAPGIAGAEANKAVGRYDEVQTRGGLQDKQHAYSRFKR